MQDVEGKVAVVTGGVSGLGLGFGKVLARAGMKVALTYRKPRDRDAAAAWFAQAGLESPLFVELDVTDRAGFAGAADEVEAAFGKVHLLVNNAGVSVFGPTDEASYADYDWIMGVNFGGVVNGLVTFIPRIKAHGEGGHIVNVASMAAYLSGPQAGIYTASKFAVRGLSECLHYNLVPHGIGVSLMCPGLTKTNAWGAALGRPAEFAESGFGAVDRGELEGFSGAFELGMEPEDVASKTLAAVRENRFLVFSHPEYVEDFTAIFEESIAALPKEEAPEGRLHIEALRRAANRAALEGSKIGISDLT